MCDYYISNLQKSDFFDGYITLLEQLTIVGTISYNNFCDHFDKMNSNIYTVKLKSNNKIVGTGAIYYEYKFIHNLSPVGHIEDIIIDEEYRKQGIGKYLIDFLVNESIKNKCYKVTLNCTDDVAKFYKKCKFINNGMQMTIYHDID